MAAEANEHGVTMEDVLDAALDEWDLDLDHPLTKSDEGQMYNMNEQDVNENSAGGGAHADSYGHFSKTWYEKDKRHRGLKIGEDGTVNGLI